MAILTDESPAEPHSPVPHAFDVAVRRAMRTLSTRGDVRMERTCRRESFSSRSVNTWACWLASQHGRPRSGLESPPTDGAEVRRAILEYVACPVRQFTFAGTTLPADPLGHRYGDVLTATAAKLRHDQFDPNYRTAFSRAVRRLISSGHIEFGRCTPCWGHGYTLG